MSAHSPLARRKRPKQKPLPPLPAYTTRRQACCLKQQGDGRLQQAMDKWEVLLSSVWANGTGLKDTIQSFPEFLTEENVPLRRTQHFDQCGRMSTVTWRRTTAIGCRQTPRLALTEASTESAKDTKRSLPTGRVNDLPSLIEAHTPDLPCA